MERVPAQRGLTKGAQPVSDFTGADISEFPVPERLGKPPQA
jgi:hypothetical protein